MILFQEGLSARSSDIALLRFWTCIELLSSRAGVRENYEQIIFKVSSIFGNPDLAALRLGFIQHSRNQMVHAGDQEHATTCAQWASIYAAHLIGFCVFNNHKLRTHSDVLDYLALGSEPQHLQKIGKFLSMKKKTARKVAKKEASAKMG